MIKAINKKLANLYYRKAMKVMHWDYFKAYRLIKKAHKIDPTNKLVEREYFAFLYEKGNFK